MTLRYRIEQYLNLQVFVFINYSLIICSDNKNEP
jgi:hypothetical protein